MDAHASLRFTISGQKQTALLNIFTTMKKRGQTPHHAVIYIQLSLLLQHCAGRCCAFVYGGGDRFYADHMHQAQTRQRVMMFGLLLGDTEWINNEPEQSWTIWLFMSLKMSLQRLENYLLKCCSWSRLVSARHAMPSPAVFLTSETILFMPISAPNVNTQFKENIYVVCMCVWLCLHIFVGTKNQKFAMLVGTNSPYRDKNAGPHKFKDICVTQNVVLVKGL